MFLEAEETDDEMDTPCSDQIPNSLRDPARHRAAPGSSDSVMRVMAASGSAVEGYSWTVTDAPA